MSTTTLQQRLAALVTQLGTDVQSMGNEVSTLEMELEQNLTLVRSDMDSNSVFTTLTWKRNDGTTFRKSVLSGGTSPQYTTRTCTYYAADGSTVRKVITHTLGYTNGLLTSETLA